MTRASRHCIGMAVLATVLLLSGLVGEKELQIHLNYPPGWKPGDKRAGIVFFFGGGWTGGSVEQFALQAEYFASRGLVAARADYRVKSRDQVTPDKCVEDARSAVRWMRKNAKLLGIDPKKLIIVTVGT